MSLKFICRPDFFSSRLSSHLGLSGGVEPGTTYFLCTDLSEVPTLVSSQDQQSLSAFAKDGKVQILICKDKSGENKASYQPAVLGTGSSAGVSAVSSYTKVISTNDGKKAVVDHMKPDSICAVTSSSDQVTFRDGLKHTTSTTSSAEAVVIRVPVYSYNSITSGLPVSSNACLQELHVSQPTHSKSEPGTSLQTSSGFSSDLPCLTLRQELKQAILQRRKDQGKAMIDLVKEETDRQIELQGLQLTDTEKEKLLKRRESNNKAARKCREKRKFQDQLLRKEVKRLNEHKGKLNDLVSTLEQQKRFLRLWASGIRKSDDETSKEMIQSIMNSEIVIPKYSQTDFFRIEEDYANSVVASSSECNSDGTRDGFELDSSQDTYDSNEDSAAVGYTEMTVDEMYGAVRENSSQTEENDKSVFKEIKYEGEDFETNSDNDADNDSDLELIEINKPLVIDVD